MDRRPRSSSDVIPCSRSTASATASQERLPRPFGAGNEIRGRAATLHTGHHVILHSGTTVATRTAVASTLVHFAEITDAEIEAYVATTEPLNVAGGFTIDGLGGPYITKIEGDHHNVVGISLPLLRAMLNELGIWWPSLWRSLIASLAKLAPRGIARSSSLTSSSLADDKTCLLPPPQHSEGAIRV